MDELLRVTTERGASFVVEVNDSEPGFEIAGRDEDGIIAEVGHKFEDSLREVKAAAESALGVFSERSSMRPSSIDLEFGVRLNAQAGAIIAKTSIEGHLTVKLSWKDVNSNPAAPASTLKSR